MAAYEPPLRLLASVLSCTDRHPLPKEEPAMLHVTGEDVTENRRPTPAEREALDLMGLDPGTAWVRLTLDGWRRVDRLAGVLADARRAFQVPVPRQSTDSPAVTA